MTACEAAYYFETCEEKRTAVCLSKKVGERESERERPGGL